MGDHSSSSSSGIEFTGALTVLFVGLKLGGVIDWSWWWVLSPLWIVTAAAVVIALVVVVISAAVAGMAWAYESGQRWLQRRRLERLRRGRET